MRERYPSYEDSLDIVENTADEELVIARTGHGHSSYALTREQLEALLQGKALVGYDGEYTLMIYLKELLK